MGSRTRLQTSNPSFVTYKGLWFGAKFFTFLCYFLACEILPTTYSNLGLSERSASKNLVWYLMHNRPHKHYYKDVGGQEGSRWSHWKRTHISIWDPACDVCTCGDRGSVCVPAPGMLRIVLYCEQWLVGAEAVGPLRVRDGQCRWQHDSGTPPPQYPGFVWLCVCVCLCNLCVDIAFCKSA